MLTTFYFNTGVRAGIPFNERHRRDAQPVALGSGQVWLNGTKQIPFECENVPEGAVFKFACNDPELPHSEHMLVREIKNSSMLTKYAYFKLG